MDFLMEVAELEKSLSASDIIPVDVRFQLNDPEAGRSAYEKSHIPGAVYLDLKEDLSGKAEQHGGSHPLPDREKLAGKLGNLGIAQDTTVVIYGESNDMFSARCLWLFRHLGHEKAYILDGGWSEWVKQENKVTTEIPNYSPKTFTLGQPKEDTVDISDVKQKVSEESAVLIDSRARERYLGKTEPLYEKAGHIPGAKNYFWKEVLDDEGNWKSLKELEHHFSDLPKDEEIIVSCGSGVSACPNVLALKQAGFKNVKLYHGSFSDWISYEDNPVEKGGE